MRPLRSLALAAFAVAGLATAYPAAAQSLQVGILNGPPMGGATPGGYCHDLMTEVAERAGLTFEYQPMPLAELIPALTSGSIDVMCSLHSAANMWRSMGLAFTSAIINNPGTLVVPTADQTPYAGLADLRGQPVAFTAGASIFQQLIQEAGAVPVQFPNGQAAYDAVVAGQVKAWFTSAATFAYRQGVLGEWLGLKVVEAFANPAGIPQHAALGVRNAETELLGQLQAALEAIKADGTLTTLLEAWALPPPVF